jgi:hypothetical protein
VIGGGEGNWGEIPEKEGVFPEQRLGQSDKWQH